MSMSSEQWISVEEKLPEIGSSVIVFGKRRAQTINGLSKEFDIETVCECRFLDENSWIKGVNVLVKVSHWQPLPKPPVQ